MLPHLESEAATAKRKPALDSIPATCWLLVLMGFGMICPGAFSAAYYNADASPPRVQANSNQVPAGSLSNGILSIELDVRQADWFPENDIGPSLKVFAFAE